MGLSVSAVELASTWPFVARKDELDTIASIRASGDCPGVVIASAAGVGKSGLARKAVSAAEHDGAFVHWIHATSSAARVPLAAFAGILAPDIGSDDLLELMRQSSRMLRERADGRTIVLGVDDAQLLDASSAALVLHLAVSCTAFVVVTLRTGEPCEDAIAALSKDAGALRIELQPLDEDETGKLIDSALGGLVEEGARRWVVDRSDGNPLYVRELLLARSEAASSSRSADSGNWQDGRR
jgi:type II secretory pathway predicted ATPase ExeA